MDELSFPVAHDNLPSNQTNFEPPLVAQLFRQQCQLFPNNPAITYKDERITYQELDWLSNQVALYLLKSGVKPHDLIGVYLDRSILLVVGILAILKVGAGYLPLDRKYPQERLNYIIQDAGIDKVITIDRLSEGLKGFSIQPLLLDFVKEHSVDIQPTDFELVSVDINSVAYVNYTSGSTGVPKGVVIPQRALLRLVFEQTSFQLDASIVILQLASAAFDAFTFELWGPLLNGGHCVLFPHPLPTVYGLREVIQKCGVNALFITPALFNALVDEEPCLFASLKYILIGGETLSAAHIRKARQALPNTKLYNSYGPTECTTFSICYAIEHIDEDAKTIPIGRPISNTSVYLLDEEMNPVPTGAVGEIYIGGPGLALGYLNKPELTNERFILAPKMLKTSGRLYKTGDLAYFSPKGLIEFVGRIDNQIKLHGFRIELDEIDSVLKQHPGIANSATIIKYDNASQKKLFSYVVFNTHSKTTISQIMAFLKEKLPYFMIPTVIHEMTSLPLNENGKLDRTALQKHGCLEEEPI